MDRYEVLFDSNRYRADSVKVMNNLNNVGINPILVQVDNHMGSIMLTFESKISKKDKEVIDEAVKKVLVEVSNGYI